MARTDLSGAVDDDHLVRLWLAGRPNSTIRVYKPVAHRFLTVLGKTVREATVADIIEWFEALTGATATIARRVSTVKSLLTFAWRTGYSLFNVGRVLKCVKVTDKLHERIIDEANVKALVDAAPEGRDRALVRLLYVGGLRISEAIALRPIDLGVGRVTVLGKGSKARTIVVPETVLGPLRALCTNDPYAPIFQSYRSKPLGVRYAREIIYQAARKAGIKAWPHLFRHCHASHSMDRGCPLHLLSKSLGHANISTTSRYLHVQPNEGSSQYLSET